MPFVGVEYGESAVPSRYGSPIVAQKKRTYTPPKPKRVYSAPKRYTAPKPAVKSYQTVSAPAAPKPAPAPKPATVAPAAPKTTIDDYFKRYLGEATNDVNSMYDKQKNARLQQFKAERDAAIGKINQQKKSVQQDFYNKRNEADVVNAQNAQRLREIMAANGISTSGENLTTNAQLSSDRMNALNALNQQEQANLQEFNGQITDLNNPSREQSLVSEVESQRSKALLDAKSNAQERAWREYTYQNMSASEKATLEWAKQQYGEDAAWRMFELRSNQETAKSQTMAELDFYRNFNGSEGGGGYTNNYKTQNQASKSGSFQTYQSHLQEAIKRGVPSSWASALTELVGRESSWNPSAKNPNSTAHGYGQFLNSTRSNYEKKMGLSYSNPVNQLVMMAQYVKDRYGSPENALAFWDKNKWY